MKPHRVAKWCALVLASAAVLLLCGAAWFYTRLRASLPELDGTLGLPGLTAPVAIERDALGVPTIRAANRLDVARATGFLHAQDRFFQMDLARRVAAGELAELFGGAPAVIELDRRSRFHRFRSVARQVVRSAPPPQRALLDAYVEGVDAGLTALQAPPPEYLLLRCRPAPWQPEDTVLVVYSMFFQLQDSTGANESALAVLRQVVPESAFQFFAPISTEWDASLEGSSLPAASVPTPDELSFRKGLTNALSSLCPGGTAADDPLPGSNNWALSGRLSRSGAALIANDMHLGLSMPPVWYRLRLVCPPVAPAQGGLDITGVTLPGAPVIVVGSNGHIAWAFTNSMLDTSDVILLELSPDSPHLYRTPEGWKQIETVTETIRVKGAPAQTLKLETTCWGPVLPHVKGLPKRALRWIAHVPEAVNFNLLLLEQAPDAESALRLAPLCGIPAQNFVVGDRRGDIGWTIMGRLPQRVGFDGRLPVSWADGQKCWDGLLAPEQYPRIFRPPGGRIWTANNRASDSSTYMALGPWDADMGARARQIRDGLAALTNAAPTDLLAIQLDHRAIFLERWQRLLLATLNQAARSNRSNGAELRQLVQGWGGQAAVDSVGYRLVRDFREHTLRLLLEPVRHLCDQAVPGLRYGAWQQESPAWVLLEQRPVHLLNPRFRSYDDLLSAAARSALADRQRRNLPLAKATWGDANRVKIQHPLSQAAPFLSRWLDIPAVSLPGDDKMPRVQGRLHGASERLVVSPGHESEGLFHMPGGQSGHFLSPFYRAGHEAWQDGKPAPFLPGPPKHRFTLTL